MQLTGRGPLRMDLNTRLTLRAPETFVLLASVTRHRRSPGVRLHRTYLELSSLQGISHRDEEEVFRAHAGITERRLSNSPLLAKY